MRCSPHHSTPHAGHGDDRAVSLSQSPRQGRTARMGVMFDERGQRDHTLSR